MQRYSDLLSVSMRQCTAHAAAMTFLINLGNALGCAVIAGVFFAFSSFVMPALARLPPAQGILAMQSINVVVINPWFMGVFLGTAVSCFALAWSALRGWSEAGAGYRLGACAAYLFGTMAVTLLANVPLNEALARLQPQSPEAELAWRAYVTHWTIWNHVRGLAALIAAALSILALVKSRTGAWGGGAGLFALFALSGCSAPLRPVPAPGTTTPLARLSELGLFEGELAAQRPRAGVVAYDVNASLYAGGANKQRFIVLPPGAKSAVSEDRWQVPLGTYFVKTFSFPLDSRNPQRGERHVETRLLVRTAEGLLASTYVWNASQTDAFASAGDLDVPISWLDSDGVRHDQPFHVPSAAQCRGCHEGRVLGWRSRQLDHAAAYTDGSANQLDHLLALGVIDARPPAHSVLVDPFGDAPLALRARSYLDANCSHCHGEGGSAEGTRLFWGFEHTGERELPACRATRAVDGRDRVLVPGHPDQSEFLARMLSTAPRVHMPRGPLQGVDRAGIALLTSWVSALPSGVCD